MRSAVLCTALVSLIAGGTLSAAEGAIEDLRLSVAFGIAEDAELDLQDQDIVAGIDESGTRIALGYVRSPWPLAAAGGFIYGGEVFYARGGGDGEGEAEGGDFDTTLFGLDLQGGYAYALPAMRE